MSSDHTGHASEPSSGHEPLAEPAPATLGRSDDAPATRAAPEPRPATPRPSRPPRTGSDDSGMLDKIQGYFGLSRPPFARNLAPAMMHRHTAHSEAMARITWCVAERGLGVFTGEVGVGKTATTRTAITGLDPFPPHRHLPRQPRRRRPRHPHRHRHRARRIPQAAQGHPDPPSQRHARHRTRRARPRPDPGPR